MFKGNEKLKNYSVSGKAILFSAAISAISFPALATTTNIPQGNVVSSSVTLNTGDILTVEGLLNVTNGSDGSVIVNQYQGATIVNSGTIKGTPADSTIAAYLSNGLNLNNSGLIQAAVGHGAEAAIEIVGATNASIYNSGEVIFSGGFGLLAASASNSYINNSGTISSGNYAYTSLDASNITFVNSGTIVTTSGDYAFTVESSTNISLENSGNIISYNQYGFRAAGAVNVSVTNTGSIIANSETVILGTNNTLINSGLIQATTEGQNAIHVTGNDTSIVLNKGTQLLGLIVVDDEVTGASLTMNHGAGASYAYSTSGDFTLIDLNNKPVVAGSAISAGIGAQETADKLLFQRTSRLNDSFAPRLSRNAGKSAFWVTPYAAQLSRDSDDATVEAAPFRAKDFGVSFGKSLSKPVTIHGRDTSLDVVVNASSNHLNIDDESQTVRSSGVLAGLLAPKVAQYRGGIISAKALVGYVKHRGDRTVITNTGSDLDVTADYHSLLAILGTEGRWSKKLPRHLHGRFIAGLDVSAEAYAAYAESQYFSWHERTLTQLSGHMDALVTHHVPGNKASLFGGFGLMGSALLSGKTSNYQINQTNVSFSGGHTSDTYGRVQGGLHYRLSKTANMTASVDWTQSIHSVSKLQGYVGIVVQD